MGVLFVHVCVCLGQSGVCVDYLSEGPVKRISPVMFTVSDFKNTQSKLTNMLTDLSCFKLYLVRQKRCHFLKIYSQVS